MNLFNFFDMYYEDKNEPVINSGNDLEILILEKVFEDNSLEKIIRIGLYNRSHKNKRCFAEFRAGEH